MVLLYMCCIWFFGCLFVVTKSDADTEVLFTCYPGKTLTCVFYFHTGSLKLLHFCTKITFLAITFSYASSYVWQFDMAIQDSVVALVFFLGMSSCSI